MQAWLISIPVWGESYLSTFSNYTIMALRAALKGFDQPYRFVIHTDRPDFIRAIMSDLPLEIRKISSASTYIALQNAHGEAVQQAKVGERVVLLNADLVVSRNLLHSCLKHIEAGRKAVVLVGIRTDPHGDPVPIGAESRPLLEWAWQHRHQIIRDLEWGHGASMLPTNIFFERGPSVVMHGFHLHPVAVVKDKEINFKSTIDGDLLDHFERKAIHVVTSPDDMSMLEISPPSRRFPVGPKPMAAGQIAASMRSRASLLHRWLFEYRIVVKGDGRDQWDMPNVHHILKIMAGQR